MRTKEEIDTEIAALKALRPTGPHKKNTENMIDMAIEELQYGVDDTAEEWMELSDNHRDSVMTARRWKEGESNERPSQGWEGLVE